MTIKIFLPLIILQIIFSIQLSNAQQFTGLNPDTVKAQKFDMGKMWTFENPPLDYFEREYNFRPTDDWLEKSRKSALRFGRGCSASFVSSDGLIMTNHHCVRGILPKLNEEDEDILNNGFFAETIQDEREVPGLFVDQLMYIKDVTESVLSVMEEGDTDSAKLALRDDKIEELKTNAYEEFPDLIFRSISFYEGGRFSLYGYKRYSDIRLLFVPELWVAKLGGDYDNFTYPRYGLDCAFLRAYDDDDKPVKTDYYFNWSNEQIQENQAVFVIGNPGSTDRIYTMAQIEYARDVRYPMLTKVYKDLYTIYEEMVNQEEELDTKLIAKLYSIGNRLKVYDGSYRSLLDPYLMARKRDFENNFNKAVQSNSELNQKYGHIWGELKESRQEAAKIAKKIFAYTLNSKYTPQYFFIADRLVELANQLKLHEDDREKKYKNENLETTIESIYPKAIDHKLQKKLLLVQVNLLTDNLDIDNKILNNVLDSRKGENAVSYLLSTSKLITKEDVKILADSGAETIINSDDPFINFMILTRDKLKRLNKVNSGFKKQDEINNQKLGEALYAVYGDTIPPDATSSLRIADGIVKGYDYNGTRAPYKTTFYGSLERYYSFNKKFPFNLPDYWEDLPDEFDLSTTLDFISTNDIIGGNSGSPVINTDAEIVGLAFDGNIESLPARYIYTTEANRTVSVSAVGMIEAIRDLYKAIRLSDEILNGSILD